MPCQNMLGEHLEEKYVALLAHKGGFCGVCLHNVKSALVLADRWLKVKAHHVGRIARARTSAPAAACPAPAAPTCRSTTCTTRLPQGPGVSRTQVPPSNARTG